MHYVKDHEPSLRRAALAVALPIGLVAALLVLGPAAFAGEGSTPMKSGASQAQASTMTITGTIEAVKKDAKGHAQSVRVVSPEHGSFLVQDEGKGAELKDHVGEKVTLMASRQRDGSGKTVLNVEHYTVHGG